MIGIALIVVAEIFSEISISLGKYEVSKRKESLYAMGFLNSLWATVFLFLWGVYGGGSFVFSLESLPIFILRSILEVSLVFISLHAILDADRSTFSFLRILTIPLLLAVDLTLGYSLSTGEIAGISIIVFGLLFLFLNHGLSRKGKLLSISSAVIAVLTITLYKYNITHFNSVEAEQTFMHAIILVVLLGAAWIHSRENLFGYLRSPVFLGQSLAAGVGSVLMSFALLFAPASVIITVKRALEVLGAIVSGQTYFKEKHLAVKLGALALISLGVLCIAL